MKAKDILSEHKALTEITAGEMLERQKGFAYQLKKKGTKYYIYHLGKNRKAFPKGVKEIAELSTIVKPWLKSTSFTFDDWSPKLQKKIINKYIDKLKKTLEE